MRLLVISIPWQFVQHDNHRLMPARPRQGQYTARLITAPEYRAAKEGAELYIKRQWRCERLRGEITLTARCFFPDNKRRDAGNYRKLLTDAMSGICYDDDSQLVREVWEKAAIDRDSPRIEITIAPVSLTEDAA